MSSPVSPAISVVIPVFNSAEMLSGTVQGVAGRLEAANLTFEVILVDDASKDRSWAAVQGIAAQDPRIRGIRFLRNRGQHSALLAGIRASTGAHVVLMDDDGQNPAAEIPTLLQEAAKGYDLVFGYAEVKRQAGYRNLASRMVNGLATHLFQKPTSVRISNFKVLSRELADRIGQYASDRPNINAEALLYCTSVTSVPVLHEARQSGSSQYTLRGLFGLFSRLLLGYSLLPLRIIIGAGLVIGTLGMLLAVFVLVRELIFGSRVPGWTSVVVLMSLMQSTMLMGLSVVGEYTMRSLERVERRSGYMVIDET